MTTITADLVLRAYTIGYFPMAEHRRDNDLFWVCPDQRGIIPLDAVHIPRKLKQVLRDNPYHITCNQDFRGVIMGCAEAKPKRPDTWISPRIMELFCELHDMGFAHSVEVWEAKELVGGLYGIALGAAFFGESMFSRVENASKIALMHLIARLRAGGYELLDTQFVTPHLKQFGAIEIGKDDYIERLEMALPKARQFLSGEDTGGHWLMELLQSSTVTS